jgi:hydroxyacylglutathione hydrolase
MAPPDLVRETMFRQTFEVGALGCNCSILGDPESGEAIVVDPGDELERILEVLTAQKLRLTAIVHTHAHIDHVGATAGLARATRAPTYLHAGDRFLYEMLPVQARMIGLPLPEACHIDRPLTDGLALRFGKHELGVLHTPGHTPGSVCFAVTGQDVCFSGDTLFAGGIGRTDLWGGDYDTIIHSIRDRLYTLNGSVEVVPGHGPSTTIDRERASNPFVTA